MRISGLASGFDTEEMVRQLMQVERTKVDRVEQNRQTILWRQESYNNMNKAFANFILNTQKDMGLKKSGSTGILTNNSHKNVDYVKKATSSNEAVATVTSSGKTENGSFDIHVKTMPKSATYTSAKMTSDDFEDTDYLEFMINNVKVKVNESEEGKGVTIDDVVKAINSATTKIGDKDVSLGVTAFYDKGTGRMFLQSAKDLSVEDGDFELNITGAGEGKGHGFVLAMKGSGDNKAISQTGNTGEVTINGLKVDARGGKVQFNGLSIDIKAASETPVTINVSTNTEGIMEKIEKLVQDYNDLVDMASGLVGEKRYSAYHPLSAEEKKAMTEDDVKLWEEKAKSGLLNRDETLQRTLQAMRTNLYKEVKGTGSFDHITQIGISTEKYSQGSAGGKLQIDTDKLRKAIEEDADGVMDLLFNEPTAGGSGEPKPNKDDFGIGDDFNKDEYNKALRVYESAEKAHRNSHGGIFTRVYDDLIDGMKAIIDKSGTGKDIELYRIVNRSMVTDFVASKGSISDLDKSVAEMNRKIDNLNILLAKREESHYAKFTAMEKAMYQMQNQSSWIAQQFQF